VYGEEAEVKWFPVYEYMTSALALAAPNALSAATSTTVEGVSFDGFMGDAPFNPGLAGPARSEPPPAASAALDFDFMTVTPLDGNAASPLSLSPVIRAMSVGV